MSDLSGMPIIIDAALSPNPVQVGEPVLVSVSVREGALPDCTTGERYSLIVDDGRLALLSVSPDLEAINLRLADRAVGDQYLLLADDGRLVLIGASDDAAMISLRLPDRATGAIYNVAIDNRKLDIQEVLQ